MNAISSMPFSSNVNEQTSFRTSRAYQSTIRATQLLACCYYHYDKRSGSNFGVHFGKAAGFIPGSVSDDTGTRDYRSAHHRMFRFRNVLEAAGFITCVDPYSSAISKTSQKWKANKDAIVARYGQEVVDSYKDQMKLVGPESVESFIVCLEKADLQPVEGVTWELTGPFTIVLRRGKEVKKLTFRNDNKPQIFRLSTFFYQKDAIRDFIQSIDRSISRLPEDVVQRLAENNEGEDAIFTTTWDINLTVRRTSSWNKETKKWEPGKSFSVKTSTRAYSPFCSYKNKDSTDRTRVLERYNLTRNFDIKSAVPRITDLLNNGVWLKNEIDEYERIFFEAKLDRPWDRVDMREKMKSNLFRLYFTDSETQCWNGYKRFPITERNKEISRLKKIAKKDPDFRKFAFPARISELYEECERTMKEQFTREEWSKLYKAVRTVLGPTFGPRIFYWESILENQVVNHFKRLGNRIVNIYDCFYFQDDLSEKEVEDYIEVAAYDLLERMRRENQEKE